MSKKISVWTDPYWLVHQAILHHLTHASSYVSGNLLDIGCGTKPYKRLFDGKIDRYIGIELPTTLSYSPEIDTYASGLHLPFREHTFQTVLSTEALEHIPEPQLFFQECYRVMVTEGVLILTTPQVWGLHEEPHDYYRYTRYGLRYLAEKSGFRIEYILPRGGLWSMIGQRLSSYAFHRISRHRFMYRLSLFISGLIQCLFGVLDRLDNVPGDTSGNLLVARKDE